jgi:CubicO group peptidase (beta-lactamase class C family)
VAAHLSLIIALALNTAGSGGLPSKSPRDVGMSAARLEAIDRVIRRGMKAGGYPGAAVVVGRKGATVWEKGFGRMGWTTASPVVDASTTIYDLASLTKVVATTTAIMVLYDRGRVALDAPVHLYLPDFYGNGRELVTIRQLLTHRSGLPAGRDIWRMARTPEEARRMILQSELVCRPGYCSEYSDLGPDLLAFVAEAVSGQSLDVLLERTVFGPLNMRDTRFRVADSSLYRVAPTELTPPRGYPLRGEVHDENAFALGGIAGHAGLFSTASDLAVFAQLLLNGGEYGGVRVIADSTVKLFTRRTAGSRALGWDTCSGEGSCGDVLSPRAFGHTGFTGTSLWIDPEREMFVVLLTNRVHAARAKRPAKVIADVRADLSDAAALAVMDAPSGPATFPSLFRADRAVGWNTPVRSARTRSSALARAKARTAAKARAVKAAKSKSAPKRRSS